MPISIYISITELCPLSDTFSF